MNGPNFLDSERELRPFDPEFRGPIFEFNRVETQALATLLHALSGAQIESEDTEVFDYIFEMQRDATNLAEFIEDSDPGDDEIRLDTWDITMIAYAHRVLKYSVENDPTLARDYSTQVKESIAREVFKFGEDAELSDLYLVSTVQATMDYVDELVYSIRSTGGDFYRPSPN